MVTRRRRNPHLALSITTLSSNQPRQQSIFKNKERERDNMEARALLSGRGGVTPLVYTSITQRPRSRMDVKSMAASPNTIRAAGKTVGSKKNSQVKLLTRVEQLKLLTKAEKAGLLSAAEKSGLSLSAIEKLGLLSKAEEFGVLSAATDPGTPGTLFTLSLGLLILGPLSVLIVPEDYPWEVIVQLVVASVSVVGGSAAFAASNFVSNLQKSS